MTEPDSTMIGEPQPGKGIGEYFVHWRTTQGNIGFGLRCPDYFSSEEKERVRSAAPLPAHTTAVMRAAIGALLALENKPETAVTNRKRHDLLKGIFQLVGVSSYDAQRQ